MVTTVPNLTIKQQLICVNCGKPWGSHAARGEWCLLDQDHGQIFSNTRRFSTIPEVSHEG